MCPTRCFDPTLICLINGPTDFDIALPAGVTPLGLPAYRHCSKNVPREFCEAGQGIVGGGSVHHFNPSRMKGEPQAAPQISGIRDKGIMCWQQLTRDINSVYLEDVFVG